MTAIIDSRPRIPRLAMVFIAAVVVMLLTAPKAGAWNVTDGDFTISRSGSGDVTVTAYNGNGMNITLPTKVTYSGTEYDVTVVGSNVLSKLAGIDGVETTVTIPEGYTSLKGNAFTNCYGLKAITIPSSVTRINYNAFEGCKNLASVTFAESSSNLSFGNKVFLGCTSLNHITLPARLSDLGAGVFQGCTSLSDLTIAADNADYLMQDGNVYVKNDDGESYTFHSYAPASSATSFTIPSEVNGKPVTSIFRLAFQNHSTLQSVVIPACVTDLKASCFEGCSALKKVSIGAESITLGGSAFVGLPGGSVIEVANETVKNAFEPSTYYTYYTADNTTIKIKGSEPEVEATPAASLTVKGAGVKDGYSYYTVKLDSAANVSTMIINLSFDASQVSQDAQVTGKPAAYTKVKDKRFTLTPKWKEEDGKVKVSLMLTTDNKAVTSEEASDLLLLALPVKTGVTGNIAMTVDSATCGGVVSGTTTGGTVSVNGSPASNRVTSYDVYADGNIDILDITEAQRFYQVSSSDTDNWSVAQKADVNADDKVDIQDLIDIFLQIEF